jgi:hypothetical protein
MVLRFAVGLAALVLILCGGLLGVISWQFGQHYGLPLDAIRGDLQQDIGFFCEQQALLSSDPWFHEPRPESDAGPLLNPWVHGRDLWGVPEGSPLALPSHLPQDSEAFESWLALAADVSMLDFGWMRQLHAYDRWDVLRSNPTRPEDRFTRPDVHFVSPLQLWAKSSGCCMA